MSRRQVATSGDRQRFIARLAAQIGLTPAQAAEHLRQAVDAGWLVVTDDGWQAALPAEFAGPDWTGPVT